MASEHSEGRTSQPRQPRAGGRVNTAGDTTSEQVEMLVGVRQHVDSGPGHGSWSKHAQRTRVAGPPVGSLGVPSLQTHPSWALVLVTGPSTQGLSGIRGFAVG